MTQANSEWNEERVTRLIQDRVPESLTLEYKASAALTNLNNRPGVELSKDVSAFANATGGIIIYGVAADPEHKTLPSAYDEGVSQIEVSVERLEQLIYTNIRPRLNGLQIATVPIAHKPGRVAYVVSIAPGDTAHQASDKRYYVRRGVTTEAMLDFEIRDVMNRRKYPVLEPRFNYITLNAHRDRHQYQLAIEIANIGSVLVHAIKLEFSFPRVLVGIGDVPPLMRARVGTLSVRGVLLDCLDLSIREPEAMIFPGDRWKNLDVPGSPWCLTYSVDHNSFARFKPDDEIIPWKLFADDMPPRRGAARYGDIQQF